MLIEGCLNCLEGVNGNLGLDQAGAVDAEAVGFGEVGFEEGAVDVVVAEGC